MATFDGREHEREELATLRQNNGRVNDYTRTGTMDVEELSKKIMDEKKHERLIEDTAKVVRVWILIAVLEALAVGSQAYIWVLYAREFNVGNTVIAASLYVWFFVAGTSQLVTWCV